MTKKSITLQEELIRNYKFLHRGLTPEQHNRLVHEAIKLERVTIYDRNAILDIMIEKYLDNDNNFDKAIELVKMILDVACAFGIDLGSADYAINHNGGRYNYSDILKCTGFSEVYAKTTIGRLSQLSRNVRQFLFCTEYKIKEMLGY